MIRITIDGLDEALRQLRVNWGDVVQKAGRAAAEKVLEVAKVYPSPSRRAQPFVSNKQRRFFFAALRDGRITVPYRRTNALASAWTISPTGAGADATNAHPHAAFVYNPQVAYHKGTWPTEQAIADKAAPSATAAAQQEVERMVQS